MFIFRAICDIQGGPKYEIKLKGEASLIEYRFSKAVINYGRQVSIYYTSPYRASDPEANLYNESSGGLSGYWTLIQDIGHLKGPHVKSEDVLF